MVKSLPASHVIAAAILLDRVVAFGALLSVGVDPVDGLRVVLALLGPFLEHPTTHRTVPVLDACEAVLVPTTAPDLLHARVTYEHSPGRLFSSKILSCGFRNRLRFHFDSEICLCYLFHEHFPNEENPEVFFKLQLCY